MITNSKCKFCECEDESQYFNHDFNHIFHICNNCGVYILNVCLDIDGMFLGRNVLEESKKLSQYASFLYYHKKTRENWNNDNTGYYVGKPEICSKFKESHKLQNKNLISITDIEVLSFYPSTLSGKETLLLRDIYKRRNDVTNKVTYMVEEMNSAAFVIRHPIGSSFYEQYMRLLNDLENDEYIEIIDDGNSSNSVVIEITTKGIKRIEEGEKHMPNTNSGNITNYGNMVLNSTLTSSIVGNGNSSGNFDYEAVKNLLSQIADNLKQQATAETESILENIEEAQEYVEQKDNKHLCSRLKTISSMIIGTCAKLPSILAFGKELIPFIDQLKSLIGA